MTQNGKIPLWFSAPLLAVLFFHLVCESMVIPILAPTLAEPVSASHDMLAGYSAATHKFVYGIALAAYPVLVFFCAPMIGALSDSIGRKPVLAAALIGTIIGCVGQGLGMELLSVGTFILGRVLVGATAGVDGVIQAALLDRCADEKSKNFYLGASLLAMSAGFMAGPAFAALLIDENASSGAWSIPFFALAPIFALTLFMLGKSIPQSASTQSRGKINPLSGLTDIAIFLKIKPARHLAAIFIFSEIAAGCIAALSPLVLADSFGFSVKQIALYMSLHGVFSSVMFALVGPKMLEKFSKNFSLRLSMTLCIVAAILPFFDEIGGFIWANTFFMASGFGLSYYVILAMFSDTADERRRGWLLSVMSSMWGLTMGIGLVLCGIAVGVSNGFCILISVVLCAVAFLMSLARIRRFKISSMIPEDTAH